MTISIVVHLQTESALHLRHLYSSLKAQQGVETEVFLFHPPGVALPQNPPESWLIQAIEPGLDSAEVWKKGLELATGEHIAFFQTSVILNPHHLACCSYELEKQSLDAIFVRPRFVDQELFPVIGAELPTLEAQDWPGFCLSSKLLWPVESAVFKKSTLAAEQFESFFEQPFAGDFLPWIQTHQVKVFPLETLDVPLESFWLTEDHEMRETLVNRLLKDYTEDQLLPTFAASGEALQRPYEAFQYICQALNNHRLSEIFEHFQADHLEYLVKESVMWLTCSDYDCYPWLDKIRQGGINPILVRTSDQPSIDETQYALSFSQEKGIAVVTISGIPEAEQDVLLLNSLPGVGQTVFNLISIYRPGRIHLTSLDIYSAYLVPYLVNTNTPLYYSLTDDSALKARQYLRYPETLSENKKYNPQVLNIQNRLVENFFRDSAAAVMIHQKTDRQKLLQAGLGAKQITDILTPKALLHVYQESPTVAQRFTTGSALPLLFQKSVGHSLEEHLAEDSRGIQPEERVLVFGRDISDFVNRLVGQQIWVQGTVFSEQEADIYKEQGLPILAGSIDCLSPRSHYYHRLYTPFALEGLHYQELRRLLAGVVLSLKKYGHWYLRLMQPRLASKGREEFWLSENHRRPYSATLVKEMLKHAGFEISSEVYGGEPYCEVLLEAELKTESLPLLNMPVGSKNFNAYWEAHPPSVTLEEQEKVLLLGPQIRKTWLMYRVQCEEMHGITLSLSDLGAKPQRTKSKHLFRHARNILKTLKLSQHKYDVILVQGLIETFTPEQVRTFLNLCHEHLTESGRLYIQTLSLDMQQDDPLFWQSALNVRPYADLAEILQEHGFSVAEKRAEDELTVYQCHRSEPVIQTVVQPNLPESIQALIPTDVKPTIIYRYQDLLKLKAHSQSCLVLNKVLEQVPTEHFAQFMQHVHQVLKPQGLLILLFSNLEDWTWEQSTMLRPYSAPLVDKLLQDLGLQKRSLVEHDGSKIWSGYRRLGFKHEDKRALKIRWEGDALNYHSLSVVNQELLKELISQNQYEIEIQNFSDPSFEPEPDSAEYPLLQHLFKSLSGQPDLLLRHHWPPDFSAPHTGGHWVMIQPWEFGSLPERWVYNINKFLDQVWVPSSFVKESYLRSGVLPEKVAIVPNGVDTERFNPLAEPLVLPTEKTFKFLFVGGGIVRKGIDILLNAFVEVFTDQDDVALVVKEFGAGKVYDTIEIAEWIDRYRRNHDNMPEIVHLNEDLPGDQMVALYNAVDCLVHPYRGEGFALPVAEAMACEKPVLVTDYGACLDYCNSDNAYLLPAHEVAFKEKQIDNTMVTVDFPYWAEPDYEALKALLRHIYENQKEAREKGVRGRKTIREQFTWQHSVLKLEAQLEELLQRPIFRFYRQHLVALTLGEAFEHIESENYSLAIQNFKKALQIDPYQPSVAYNIGVAYLMQQDYSEALEYLTRSLREGEITADLCYAMGTVLRHLGDYPTSQEFFKKARDLDPGLFDLHEEIPSAALVHTQQSSDE